MMHWSESVPATDEFRAETELSAPSNELVTVLIVSPIVGPSAA